MKMPTILLTIISLLFFDTLLANSGQEVLQKNGCLNCHAQYERKVGPPFLAIANKYRNDKQAQRKLVNKLKNGQDHMKILASNADLNAVIKSVLNTN